MKKIIILLINLLISLNMFAQNVEKLISTESIRLNTTKFGDIMPIGISVDELNYNIYLFNGGYKGAWVYNSKNNLVNFDKTVKIVNGTDRIILNDFIISYYDSGLFVDNNNIEIANLNFQIKSGISFILKKDNGYIIYYVDEKGIPGAVDTTGRIYTNIEAIEYLKQYDSEKFEQSLSRAKELGLYDKFIKNEVLVWGQTYYSTTYIKEALYEKGKFPYLNHGLILYDNSGYSYQIRLMYQDSLSKLCIVSPTGEDSIKIPLKGYSDMIYDDNSWVSTSWYVGFGGNIYYYIAGEEYTEVFRIRRTWGDPDFYAMAINGYTDDEYGKYVDEVLPNLSKADLRLLRNTIFALYGVHFKSEDLSKHFDKQVWYTDEGKTSAEVTLPAHRQKLVEMIQKLESK